MNIAKLGAVIVTGALSVAAVNSPALAASVATNIFLSNATPNVDFLDRSSRFALTNSKNPRIRDFAHGEAKEQTAAANVIDDWIAADKPQVADATQSTDQVTTGRSVAIDGAPASAQAIDNRLPRGPEDLDLLGGIDGREFDDAYKERQLDALRQIETDYQTYIASGDDPTLLALSKRQLPAVRHRLELLQKL